MTVLVLTGAGCIGEPKKCIKSHTETVYHEAVENYTWVEDYWTGAPSKVYAGTTPAYETQRTVCDEYETK